MMIAIGTGVSLCFWASILNLCFESLVGIVAFVWLNVLFICFHFSGFIFYLANFFGSSRLMVNKCLYFNFTKLACLQAIFSYNDHFVCSTDNFLSPFFNCSMGIRFTVIYPDSLDKRFSPCVSGTRSEYRMQHFVGIYFLDLFVVFHKKIVFLSLLLSFLMKYQFPQQNIILSNRNCMIYNNLYELGVCLQTNKYPIKIDINKKNFNVISFLEWRAFPIFILKIHFYYNNFYNNNYYSML